MMLWVTRALESLDDVAVAGALFDFERINTILVGPAEGDQGPVGILTTETGFPPLMI